MRSRCTARSGAASTGCRRSRRRRPGTRLGGTRPRHPRTDEPSLSSVTEANAAFWDELCGSSLARLLGIVENTPSELARFDAAYLAFYPYLTRYLDALPPGRTLEIGVGYGTVARLLAARVDYHAVDIAAGPVEMARQALRSQGKDPSAARQASALDLPFGSGEFDVVVA